MVTATQALPPVTKISQMIEPTGRDPVNLRPRGPFRVYMLPGNCDKVIVQYHPTFTISCVIPPFEHTLYVRDRYTAGSGENLSGSKKTPHLLWSGLFAHSMQLPEILGKGIPGASFTIYKVNLKRNDEVWLTSYNMPNVHVGTGNICWGSVGSPRDLKQANSMFWASPFNGDLSRGSREPLKVLDAMKKYRGNAKWTNRTNQICGDRWVACRNHVDGVIFTDNAALLKQVPAEDRKDILVNREVKKQGVLALGNRLRDGSWVFTTGNFVFRLPASKVKGLKITR